MIKPFSPIIIAYLIFVYRIRPISLFMITCFYILQVSEIHFKWTAQQNHYLFIHAKTKYVYIDSLDCQIECSELLIVRKVKKG